MDDLGSEKKDIIRDVFVKCRFDGAYRDALLSLKLVIDGVYGDGRLSARWYLYEAGEKDVYASSSSMPIPVKGKETEVPSVSFELSVSEPQQWSAEAPFLYNLVVEVSAEDGHVVDRKTIVWGFRQVEVLSGRKGGQLILNGRPIKLHGINRTYTQTSQNPSWTRDEIEADLLFLRRLNVNAIFTAVHHCPADLYALADRIGIYLIDSGTPEDDAPEDDSLTAMNENHPSIVCRSEVFHHQRIACNQKASAIPIVFQDKPVILWVSELNFGLGECMEKLDKQLNIAGVGIIETDEAETINSKIMLERSEIAELQFWFTPVAVEPSDLEHGLVAVHNRNVFVNLLEFELRWFLQRDGQLLAEGRVHRPDIMPGQSQPIHLFRDISTYHGTGEGFVTILLCLKEENTWGKAGMELGRRQFSLPEVRARHSIYPDIGYGNSRQSDDQADEEVRDESPSVPWQYKIHAQDLLLVREKVGLRVNLETGLTELLDFGLGNILSTGIRPFAMEGGNHRPYIEGLDTPITLSGQKIKHQGENLELQFKLKAPVFGKSLRLTMRLTSDGKIVYSFSFKAPIGKAGNDPMILLGLQSQFREISWYGCGPHQMLSSSQKSSVVGVYAVNLDSMESQEVYNYVGVRRLWISDRGNVLTIAATNKLLKFCCGIDGSGNSYIHIGNDDEGDGKQKRAQNELQMSITCHDSLRPPASSR